jgi:hypothetical protein
MTMECSPSVRRCAIYTRKSSEEGLTQDFNSLHAQREACEAFIKSQQSEGWHLLKIAYDDGGFSGATRLLRQGLSQSEVARALGVHRQSVSRWARELGEAGVRGLRKAGRSGSPTKLIPAQLRELERALKRGPEAFGFASGLWTASRVCDLIEYCRFF